MRGRAWLCVAVVALVGALFTAGFPARALLAQRHERQQVARQVHDLVVRNRALGERSRVLQTDAEIERLARSQYGLARPGEEVFAVLPPAGKPPAPAATPARSTSNRSRPAGWRAALARVTDLF
jgi:cell division protein FtsB